MLRYPATLICILFILYLFWTDRKKSDGPSNALWIPLIWMFLVGSRYVSSWLSLRGGSMASADVYAEGSPVDAAAFFLLILTGVFILFRRKIDWGLLLAQNKWIWLYLLYCGLSITWSDIPFVSLKRFVKDLGNPVMVLVILTEKRPFETAGVILRRLAYLWLPLSVLFIWYYPALGRSVTPGGMQLGGVAGEKNALGLICLISGIYFSWKFLLNRKPGFKWTEKGNINDFMLMGMVVYLLRMSQSATSLACLVVATSMFFISRTKVIAQKPGRIIAWMMAAASLFIVLYATLDVRSVILELLGRDATLTGRTALWEAVEGTATNPIVGTGFMSFWSGDRLRIVTEKIGAFGLQAHNGYLEQYLNLGCIGVAFIGLIILSGLLKVRRHLNVDYPSAMLRLCFIVTALLYNYTEASFYGLSNMWLLTLFAVIEMPRQQAPEGAEAESRHQQSR